MYPTHQGEDPLTKKQVQLCPNKLYVMRDDANRIDSQTEMQSIREEREWRAWVDDVSLSFFGNVETVDALFEALYTFDIAERVS